MNHRRYNSNRSFYHSQQSLKRKKKKIKKKGIKEEGNGEKSPPYTRKTLVISLETMRKSKGNAIFPVGGESVRNPVDISGRILRKTTRDDRENSLPFFIVGNRVTRHT